MNIEDIANALIKLKEESKLIEVAYQDKRREMYNKLTNTQQSSFEYNGFKFSKTQESETRNVTKDKLFDALSRANISEELRSQIFNDSQNEVPRLSNIRISKLN